MHSPNTGSTDGGVAYGVRFKASDGGKGSGYGIYTTAMRYEYKKDYPSTGNYSVIIRWKYLGANSTVSMDIVHQESWWGSYDVNTWGQERCAICAL